jgi:hypothetical protein
MMQLSLPFPVGASKSRANLRSSWPTDKYIIGEINSRLRAIYRHTATGSGQHPNQSTGLGYLTIQQKDHPAWSYVHLRNNIMTCATQLTKRVFRPVYSTQWPSSTFGT